MSKSLSKIPGEDRLAAEYIFKIIDRAEPTYREFGLTDDRITMFMDLDFANQSCPIDLQALLAADQSTFNHDVFGIRRHMNRQTKQLEGCFLPRTALIERS